MANPAKPIKLPIDVSDLLGLTPILLRFIGEYCSNNFDEVAAFRKVWPSKAKDMSSAEIRLESLNVLNHREVKIAVQRFVDSILSPYKDRIEHQLFNLYRQRAFYDPAEFFNPDGSPKKLDQIDKEKRLVLDSVTGDLKGKDANAWLVNYKLADRMQAAKSLQDLMGKSLDLIEQKDIVNDDSRKRVQDIMSGAMAGIRAMKQIEKEEQEKKASPVVENAMAEYDIEPDDPAQIEAPAIDPILMKAREIASKQQGGIGVDAHPLVKQAEALVKDKRQNQLDMLKGALGG
jgi:hypothetical protein